MIRTRDYGAHLAMAVMVLLWLLPSAGLVVSSFRDRAQIAESGWWRAASPARVTGFARSGTAQDQREESAAFVIDGALLDVPAVIERWGLDARSPDAFAPGEIARRDGAAVTVNADGRYRMTSRAPFDIARGQRIFYTAAHPPRLTAENYARAMRTEQLAQSFAASIAVTIPATILPVLIAALAAYALAWMRFAGRGVLLAAIAALMVVPLQMTFIPLLRLHHDLGLGKGYVGIWLAHTGFALPLAIFILHRFMARIPAQIIDSARLDGAGEFQIFRQIALPLTLPALAGFATFQFLWVWNDLLVATVFLGTSRDQLVLTGVLRELMGSRGGEWEMLAASAVITMIAPLAVFFAMQKYLVSGMLAGASHG